MAKLTKTEERLIGTPFERVAISIQKNIYEALMEHEQSYMDYFNINDPPTIDELIIFLLDAYCTSLKQKGDR